MTNTDSPLISVVISVYNGKGVIEDCIKSLYDSRFGPFEVILVDDHSTDGALEGLSSFPIRIVSNDGERGVSRARNLGIQQACAEIILLLDADILVSNDFLARVYQFFKANPEIHFLQGSYNPNSCYKNIMSEYKNLIFSFRAHQEGKTYVSFIHSACVAGRTKVLKQYLFNTWFTRREDIEYGLRVSQDGFKIYHDPDFKVLHKRKFSFISFFRYQFVTARQMVFQRFSKQDKNISLELRRPQTQFYKKTWYLRPVVSVLVILSLLGLLFGTHLFWKFMLLGSLVAMLIFDAPFLNYLYRFAPRKVFFLAPALYLLDGFAAGLGFFSGLWEAYKAKK